MEELIRIAASPETVTRALAQAAEEWGGHWKAEGGRGELWIPVSAGLRKGYWHGGVETEVAGPDEKSSQLRVEPKDVRLQINRGAAMILFFGAAGGVVAMLWPFFPALLQIGPFAIVLAIAAWLLVSGRLRNSGLEEFLETV